jgi:hypothetical protein
MTDFKKYVKEHMQIHSVPFFDVKIDLGEKNRQRIEEPRFFPGCVDLCFNFSGIVGLQKLLRNRCFFAHIVCDYSISRLKNKWPAFEGWSLI